MLMNIVTFIIGLIIGTIGGVTLMAILQISGMESRREENEGLD